MDLPRTADVVVAGAGIVGCASAFYLARAGLRTLVLERRAAIASLTTAASLEAVRAQFDEPENVAMMSESLAVFERFAEVVGLAGWEIGLHQQGYLFCTTSSDGPEVLRERQYRQREAGLDDVEALDGGEARARFPYLDHSVTAATFRQRDGWLSAYEVARGFATASGAPFVLGTAVEAIRIRAGAVEGVETASGFVSTPIVVVACGPFSNQLLATAGAALPLALLRRQRVTVAPDPAIPQSAPMTVDLDTGAHWRPDGQGAALGWALPEEPSEPLDHVPVDWTFPAVVFDGCARLSPFWSQVTQRLSRERIRLTAGQYDVTPDHKPVVGPLPGVTGLYVNAGYSGHGVMGAPAGARLLADLVTGAASASPFRVERFREGVARAERVVL